MRRLVMSLVLAVASLSAVALPGASASAATSGGTAALTGKIVSEEPSRTTPNILDGTVYSITQVGNTIVVGGEFSQVENANTSTVLTRNNVFAFNATTGKITSFAPNPNGTVFKVLPAADGTSVYLGGGFTSATSDGATITAKYLYEADAATGKQIAAFTPPAISSSGSTVNFAPQVRDLELTGNRLWVAGKFMKLGTNSQVGLGTLNATTGAYDSYFTGVLAGLHNTSITSAVTDVLQISTNPSNTKLMAVGNFTTVDGAARSQIAMLDISGASSYALAAWNTNLYTSSCSSKFDTYMSDVEFSPDGSYFVVSTSGAWGGSSSSTTGNGCDVVTRFESGATGTAVTPTWAAYTGGDTTWTVEVTDNVIYTGGHMRWQNNPTKGDAAGQGAVARTGIAALNPLNGMAYSWNPTRARGVGVQDMMATSQGLYVGSDTTLLGPTDGNRYHARIAMLPLAGGKTLPAETAYNLPSDVYSVATAGSQLVKRTFNGGVVASSTNAPNGSVAWGSAVGAFMVNGNLYTATSDGTLSKQTFDGTTYGAATTVATADQIVPQTDWHGTDVPQLTSLFYSGGRIYFTLSGTGNTGLYSRGFEDEDDVVGQIRYTTKVATGNVTYANVRGAFVAGGKLYYSDTTGKLFSATWNGTAPVGGTLTQVSGSGKDSQNWASRAMFVYQAAPTPVNQAPTASLKVHCAALTCSYDGTASTDDDGTVASYDWDFGDGSSHGTGATATHTYASAGDNTVTLKVTDNGGSTGSTTGIASANASASPITYAGGATTTGNRTSHSVTVPSTVKAGDTLVLFFVANSNTGTFTGPSGWTQLQTASGDGTEGRLWTKQATTADVGKSVAVTTSATVKDTTTVAAYRGTSTTAPVTSSAATVEDDGGAAHTTPPLESPNGSSWLLSYWADKSATTTKFTIPSDQTARTAGTGSSSGHVTGQLADSGGTVNTGANGALTATADSASSRGITFSVLLAPAGPNTAPVAHASLTGCSQLSCSFDASTSTDADGDALSYDWDFGDGSAHDTTVNPTHVFGSGGDQKVTLTVTDARGATSTDTVTATTTAPPVNHAPVAHATLTGCTDLSCSFDASTSTDADGDALTYTWSFGDGAQATGVTSTHAYTSSGSKTVTLTVTDPQGLSSTDTVTATPADPAFTDKVSFVDAASTSGNRSAHKVTVPATVKAGDTLLLFFVANTTTPAYTGPSGWTNVQTRDGDGTVGRVWTKTATAADAGSTVTVTSLDSAGASYLAKDAMTVAAYRGTSATPVVASASALQTTSTTVHTTPTVTAPDGHEWLVSYWADKSTNTTAITGPAGQTSRSAITAATSGSSGHITGLLADSAGVVASGTQGGLAATADSAGNAAQTFSVLLASS